MKKPKLFFARNYIITKNISKNKQTQKNLERKNSIKKLYTIKIYQKRKAYFIDFQRKKFIIFTNLIILNVSWRMLMRVGEENLYSS